FKFIQVQTSKMILHSFSSELQLSKDGGPNSPAKQVSKIGNILEVLYCFSYLPVSRTVQSAIFIIIYSNTIKPPICTSLLDLTEDPTSLHYIRNEDQGFQQWTEDTIERDAPARTPTQDSFLFQGVTANFQQDQCGRRHTSITDFLRDFSNFRQTNQGSVLLKTLDFDDVGSPFILENKITYGIETENKEAPWQVAIFIKGKFHCGASLIGVRHVLTAAHCVTAYRTRPHILELSIGDWDLATTEDGQNVEAQVKKITAHKDFNFFDLQNDIAVLELKNKVEFNDRIRPICIPPADLNIGDVPITITGWGRNERNKLQTRLQKLTAIPVKKSICADRWTETGAPRSIIGAKTICIDTQFGDSCKGDSGGPAIMEHPSGSGKYVQAGIVSFGSGSCTDFRLPGVYTLVPLFRDWIIQNIS
ncbi:Suppressor of tumorigenicity 14 protein-like, partial [Armadillidium vulgare]